MRSSPSSASRAGSRRRKGWGVLLGVCLLIFAGLAFASLSSLAAQKPGTLMRKVIVPTVIILAAAGIFSLVVALVRRSYNRRTTDFKRGHNTRFPHRNSPWESETYIVSPTLGG